MTRRIPFPPELLARKAELEAAWRQLSDTEREAVRLRTPTSNRYLLHEFAISTGRLARRAGA